MPATSIPLRALRLVTFGMPHAGKSSLLGAMLQAAQSQQQVFPYKMTDQSGRLADLQRRVYQGPPLGTVEEIVPYPVRFDPVFPRDPAAEPADAVLIDCSGEIANELLSRPDDLETGPAGNGRQLRRAILDADALLLTVDAAADPAHLESDFRQFGRFLRLFRQHRGRHAEISGLPVFLVLTKADLLAKPTDDTGRWLDSIEETKARVGARFREFSARPENADTPLFGGLDLQLAATAVRRPDLAGSPAKPLEPYGIAELLRLSLDAARRFRARSDLSGQRLAALVFGSIGILVSLGLLGVGLVLVRDASLPNPTEQQVVRFMNRDQELSPAARYRTARARLDELNGYMAEPGFASLSDERRREVTARAERLKAYLDFEGKLARVRDPREAVTIDQLAETVEAIKRITLTPEQRAEWTQSPALRTYDDWLADAEALQSAVAAQERWYRKLVTDGQAVLDRANEGFLPRRAKKILDEGRAPPFPDRNPSAVVPGGRRATYADAAAFTAVRELRQRWDTVVRPKLEDAARLEGL